MKGVAGDIRRRTSIDSETEMIRWRNYGSVEKIKKPLSEAVEKVLEHTAKVIQEMELGREIRSCKIS